MFNLKVLYDKADFIAESGKHDGKDSTSTKSRGKDSVYEELHLMPNLAVIEVLSRWFYGYLLILKIFSFFGGVVT